MISLVVGGIVFKFIYFGVYKIYKRELGVFGFFRGGKYLV